MSISGIDSIATVEGAAASLKEAAQATRDQLGTILEAVDTVGCRGCAAALESKVGESTEHADNVAKLMEDKKDELTLATAGIYFAASEMYNENTALELELDEGAELDLEIPDEVLSDAEVDALAEELREHPANTPEEIAARNVLIERLTAQLERTYEGELEHYDPDIAADIAQAVANGAHLWNAQAYFEAGDDLDKQAEVLNNGFGDEGWQLAVAVMPMLDPSDKQDLMAAGVLASILDPAGLYVFSVPFQYGESDTPLTPAELEQALFSLERFKEGLKHGDILGVPDHMRTDVETMLEQFETGLKSHRPLLVEQYDAAMLEALSEGGDLREGMDFLMQYGERDPKTGLVTWNEDLLSYLGIPLDKANADYMMLVSAEAMEHGLPQRANLYDILDQAGFDPAGAMEALSLFANNYDLLVELNAMGSGMGIGWHSQEVPEELFHVWLAALDATPAEVAGAADRLKDNPPEGEVEHLVRLTQLASAANIRGWSIEEYLEDARAGFDHFAESKGMSTGDLKGLLVTISANSEAVYKIAGAGLESSALLRLESAADLLALGKPESINIADVNASMVALGAREVVSLDDLDEIDSIKTGSVDGKISDDDIWEWLAQNSDRPFAHQNALLMAARAQAVDLGELDNLLNITAPLGTVVQVIGGVVFFFNPVAGGLVMTAGGLISGGSAVAVAAYKGDWGTASVEGIFALLDVIDGATEISSIGTAYRIRRLKALASTSPEAFDALAPVIKRLQDVQAGTGEPMTLGELEVLIAKAGDNPAISEGLALASRQVKLSDGTVVKLSPEGARQIGAGGGGKLDGLATNWADLDVDESWELYQLTAKYGKIDEATFRSQFDSGLRYNPYTTRLRNPNQAGDRGALRRNMLKAGRLPPDVSRADGTVADFHAHHIVPFGDARGGEAAKILDDFGVDINDAANGVYLPARDRDRIGEFKDSFSHQGAGSYIHSNEYYSRVNKRVDEARERAYKKFGDNATDIEIAGELKRELEKMQDALRNGKRL